MSETRIIEINGIKMEVDLRHAKRIDTYKVGDNIKVLIKEYDDYKSYIGCIVGFDNFESNPTIVIAYLYTDYSTASVKFLHYHTKTKGHEITDLNDWDMPLTKSEVIDKFNVDIHKKEQEVRDLKQKMNVFEKLFGKYFDKVDS